jgi:serine protease Do
MRRVTTWGWAVVALATGALFGSPAVRGAENADKVVRPRRIEVIRMAGSRLGVQIGDVGKDDVSRLRLGEERGAVVLGVEDDSPAAKAGLKKDDVILRFQGEAVQSAATLSRMVRETPPGRTVNLEVSRGGSAQKMTALLQDRGGPVDVGDFDLDVPMPPEPPVPPVPPMPGDVFKWKGHDRHAFMFPGIEGGGPRRLGIAFQDVSGQLAKFLHAPSDRAVMVVSVDEGSAAEKAGIKAGDLIVRFSGREIRDTGDLREEVRRAESGKEVGITVHRDGKPVELKATLRDRDERGRHELLEETT